MNQSPITMDTEHEGDFDSLVHEFTMHVDSDDGKVFDECWIIKLDIHDPEMQEFEVEIFWGDPDTGDEFSAFPLDVRVRDEIDKLTQDAIDELNLALNPTDEWSDAGVTQADFL